MNTPNRLRAHIRRLTPITIAAMALVFAPSLTGLASESNQNTARALKVFISVDMEGLAGVATSADVNAAGRDYEHFRKIMAAETNAAIEGAFRAGVTEIVVRDSHGGKTNLLPGNLSRAGPRQPHQNETLHARAFVVCVSRSLGLENQPELRSGSISARA